MKENMMVGTHRYTSKEYAEGWDRIFGKKEEEAPGPRGCSFCKHFWACLVHKKEGELLRWLSCKGFSHFELSPWGECQI